MNSYEEKQERKRERLERAADNAQSESDRRLQSARTSIDGIPSGQPILIDHHSARRHRGALKKHDAHMRAAVDAEQRATELARRAAAVGTGGISSDDPDAIAKLDDKRTDLERQRDNMKAINALYRKRDEATLVARFGYTLEQLDAMVARGPSWDRQPYPKFTLTNLSARIRQAAKRVAKIEATATMSASEETVGAGTIVVDTDDNRVAVRFAERLSKEDYKRMRSGGFVWSPTRNAFVRKLSNGAVHWARHIVAQLDASKALTGGAQ